MEFLELSDNPFRKNAHAIYSDFHSCKKKKFSVAYFGCFFLMFLCVKLV